VFTRHVLANDLYGIPIPFTQIIAKTFLMHEWLLPPFQSAILNVMFSKTGIEISFYLKHVA